MDTLLSWVPWLAIGAIALWVYVRGEDERQERRRRIERKRRSRRDDGDRGLDTRYERGWGTQWDDEG